ncbi:MAG: cytochrome-c peroxidase [Fibrobacteres bacterium]|nr:cytochrome-c peroxidase [Fibrobacterota bacterium]
MLAFSGCMEDRNGGSIDPPDDKGIPAVPRGFPPLPYPSDNPPTADKINLGRRLFFDPRLSRDGSVSCATCHKPEGSFAVTGLSFNFGIDGHATGRNAPTLANVAYNSSFFFDGKAPTLEAQALAPIISPLEMDMDTARLPSRLGAIGAYRESFPKAWGDGSITMDRITGSIASFERSMLSGGSPFDRFLAGDSGAISAEAKRGRELFFGGKAACFRCHDGFNFTDRDFHNTGLDTFAYDPGRRLVTGLETDDGRFKTPSLRNLTLTPPYMHDGRFNTLKEVLIHYNEGAVGKPNRDPLLGPLGLDEGEMDDLIRFLESLTDSSFAANPDFKDPWIP